MNNELLAIELVKRLGGKYEKRGNSVIYTSPQTGLSYVCRVTSAATITLRQLSWPKTLPCGCVCAFSDGYVGKVLYGGNKRSVCRRNCLDFRKNANLSLLQL